MILLKQCHVSELAARGPRRRFISHPLADVSLSEQAQMRLDLVVEFLTRSTISDQSSKSRRQSAQIIDHLYPLPLDLFF
jgi:hypothetical protein